MCFDAGRQFAIGRLFSVFEDESLLGGHESAQEARASEYEMTYQRTTTAETNVYGRYCIGLS